MNGLPLLVAARLRRHAGRTALLAGCTALALFLPAAGALLLAGWEREVVARAEATPMVLGARGSRFDLALGALWFRARDLEPVPWRAVDELRPAGKAIPLRLGDTARRHPVVGTTPEYFALRGLRPTRGTLPLFLGDACLGAAVARRLGLEPGATLMPDPRRAFDPAAPAPVALHVTGVLAPSGTADDEAVFIDVKTAWLLDGLVHGHGDAATNGQVLARTQDGGNVVLDAGLREHARITPENLDDFHVHGDPAELPLSAVLFLPDSAKAATMTRARIEVAGRFQMLVPRDVVGELLAVVFAAKRLFDAVAAVLAAITVALTVLVLTLAARLRRSETEALHRLGCSRRTVALLHVGEVGAVFAAGAVLAGVLVAVAVAVVPDPMRWFGA